MRIKVEGLEFKYTSSALLRNVTFQIKQGEMIGLIGPNGSGKSTLLRCLARVLRPQKGLIWLDGKEIKHFTSQELAHQIGYVPQSQNQVFSQNVFDAVLLGRKPYLQWRVTARDKAIVARILRFMGLEDKALSPLSNLSGGERQKVILARALAQEPAVLLLDEPTSNLDIKHQLEVLGILKRLAEMEGRIIILVLHDLNLAARYAHRLILLKQGEIVAAGSPVQVLEPSNLATVYGIEASVTRSAFGIQVTPIKPLTGEELNTEVLTMNKLGALI